MANENINYKNSFITTKICKYNIRNTCFSRQYTCTLIIYRTHTVQITINLHN